MTKDTKKTTTKTTTTKKTARLVMTSEGPFDVVWAKVAKRANG